MKKRASWVNYALLLVTAAIWGFAFTAQKESNAHYGPFTIQFLRSLLAAAFLFPLAAVMDRVRGTGRHLLSFRGGIRLDVTRQEWLGGALCGLALSVASVLQQFGMVYNGSAGKTAFITSLYVALVPLLGLAWGKRTSRGVWCGVVGSLIGAAILSLDFSGQEALSYGDMLVLLCAVGFACQILLIDRFSPRTDGVRLSAVQFLCSALVTLPFALMEEQPGADWAAGLPAILYLGLLSSGVAYTLQILVQRHTHPAAASVILSLESVFGVFGGALAFGEVLSAREYIGCAILFLSVLATGLSDTARTDAPAEGAPAVSDEKKESEDHA